MRILAYFYKLKVSNTPSVENYDNSFSFSGNLMIKWAKPTENMSHVIAHEMHPGKIGKQILSQHH